MGNIKFKRNPKTGIVEGWKNGKHVGNVYTMGDMLDSDKSKKSGDKVERDENSR